MDPEKPARRSRPKKDPVTIDLEAEKATEETASAETSEPTADRVPEEPQSGAPEAFAAEKPSETKTDDPAPEPTYTDEAAREAIEEPPTEGPKPIEPVHAAPSRGGAGLLAAGIVGGVVALALAGSMQYAGYLPSASKPTASSEPSFDASGLETEIASLKSQIADLKAAPAGGTADPQLETRIAALEQAQQNAGSAQPFDSSALESQIAGLNDTVAALKSELARTAEAQTETTQEITDRLATAEKKIDEPRKDVSMARAVAAATLKTAIDRGGPFQAELATLEGVAPDSQPVKDLAPYAAIGVPSRSDLARQFSPVADRIIEAVNQPAGDESLTDRLLSSAKSLIKVRPVGMVEGDSVEAIVARMEEKLKNGDLKGAAIEWESLPDAGKQASSDFKDTLDKRIKVEELAESIMTSAVAGTN
ncbi:mitofilin family membrane protein [Rhizobium sp. PAMB 3182]